MKSKFNFLKEQWVDLYESAIKAEAIWEESPKESISILNEVCLKLIDKILIEENEDINIEFEEKINKLRLIKNISTVSIELFTQLHNFNLEEIEDEFLKYVAEDCMVRTFHTCAWLAVNYGEYDYNSYNMDELNDEDREAFYIYLVKYNSNKAFKSIEKYIKNDKETERLTMIKNLIRKGRSNDKDALFELGQLYEDGKLIAGDAQEAYKYYKKAAKAGKNEAYYKIGKFYEDGIIENYDEAEALKWYKKGAEKEDNDCLKKIGELYFNGIEIECENGLLEKALRLLSEEGNNMAQVTLGALYEEGVLGKIDYDEALDLYMQAAKLGDELAMYNIGNIYEEAIGVDKDLKLAFKWYLKAAENGDVDAQVKVGSYYELGIIEEKNSIKALKWYRIAALKGDEVAQFNLANLYENGIGVEKDEEKAIYWYKKSSEMKYDLAIQKLKDLAIDK